MNIEQHSKEKYQVFKLIGDVDLSNSKNVKNAVIDVVKSGKDVIVDFSELNYIDSSGMASLVEIFNESKATGSQFFIAGAQGSPKQVLQLTRLDTVFSVRDSVEKIIADE